MKSPFPRNLLALALCMAVSPASAFVCPLSEIEEPRCGQPHSTGSSPTVSDALVILEAAVGIRAPCDDHFCWCDVNCDGTITSGDALLLLRHAVGQSVCLDCCCNVEPPDFGCSSAELSVTESDFDYGWRGIARDEQLPAGITLELDVIGHCSSDQATCRTNSDCNAGNCISSCDCLGDTSCELAGPGQQHRCGRTLKPCGSNAFCLAPAVCAAPFAPPQPLSSGGTPVCIVAHYEGPVTGTLD